MIVIDLSKFNPFRLILLIASFFIPVAVVCAYPPLLTRSLEAIINSSTKPFFSETVWINKAWIDRDLKLHVQNLQAEFQTESGPVPVAVRNIASAGPIYDIFKPQGVYFNFEGAHFQHSNRIGINGKVHIRGIRKWFLDFRINVVDIGLDELTWLSHENLARSTGKLSGLIKAKTNYLSNTDLEMILMIREPGGTLQGKFFALLVPYLPVQAAKEVTAQLVSLDGLVHYKNAEIHVNLIRPNQLKVILKILIPDYNLDLNVKLLIRLEDQNSIGELAELMGIVKTERASS